MYTIWHHEDDGIESEYFMVRDDDAGIDIEAFSTEKEALEKIEELENE